MTLKQKIIQYIPAILLLLFAVGFGFAWGLKNQNNIVSDYDDSDVRQSNSHFTLINPLLECGALQNVSNRHVDQMKATVTDIIAAAKGRGDITFASVYFRDLNNGPWFGINEKENFLPGSLLKVPMLITAYKEASLDPTFLNREVEYKATEQAPTEHFGVASTLVPGSRYKVSDLVQRMIHFSDNSATQVLYETVNPQFVSDTFNDLGIETPKNAGYEIPVKLYASFFRILYNATYLNKAYSEKALGELSQTTFDQGLRKGVPPTIVVSHKYGERFDQDAGIVQLHDCGIIYYPKIPYLLCIMTRGTDLDRLAPIY